jgi:hypothetical protein
VIPGAGRLWPRVERWNADVRAMSAATGSIVVDLAQHAVAADRRLWSDDRLHANSTGHARIAHALAHALGLEGFDDSWQAPLPPLPRASMAARAVADAKWAGRFLAPWLLRRITGASSGDGIRPKRPALQTVT